MVCIERGDTEEGDGNEGNEAKQAINYGLIDVHSGLTRGR
jgi:hypothetical protein